MIWPVGGRWEGVDVNAQAGRTLARSIGEAALVACSERAVGSAARRIRGPTAAQAAVDATDLGSAAL